MRLLSILIASIVAAPLAAQDVLTVGSANGASPGTVVVPIYYKNVEDGGVDHWVKTVALCVELSPETTGLTASIRRSGLLASVTPEHERRSPAATRAGYFLWLDYASIPLSSAPGYGSRIAELTVTIPPGLPDGQRLALRLVPERIRVANEQTLFDLEGRPYQTLVNGEIAIGTYWGDATKDGKIDLFDLVVLAAFMAGNVSEGQPPFLGTRASMNLNPAQGPDVDIFDLVLLAGYLVGNVGALPVP